jgi:hypothetical protein
MNKMLSALAATRHLHLHREAPTVQHSMINGQDPSPIPPTVHKYSYPYFQGWSAGHSYSQTEDLLPAFVLTEKFLIWNRQVQVQVCDVGSHNVQQAQRPGQQTFSPQCMINVLVIVSFQPKFHLSTSDDKTLVRFGGD